MTGFGKIAGLYVRLLVCGRKPKDPRNYLSCCSWIFHLNNTIGTLKLLFLFSIYLLLLSLPFYYLFVFIICVFLLFCHYLSIYPATNQSFTFYICQFIFVQFFLNRSELKFRLIVRNFLEIEHWAENATTLMLNSLRLKRLVLYLIERYWDMFWTIVSKLLSIYRICTISIVALKIFFPHFLRESITVRPTSYFTSLESTEETNERVNIWSL